MTLDIAAAFRVNAATRRVADAVVTVDRTVSYGELDDRSSAVHGMLAAAGIGPGDRVAVQLPNRVEFVELVLGIQKAGAVLVPISYLDGPSQVEHIIGDSGARAIVFDATTAASGGAATGTADGPLGIGIGVPDADLDYEGAVTSATRLDPHTAGPDRPFYIGYTSGSTGAPKGVVKSHRAIVELAHAVAIEWGLERGARQLVTMPMCHSGGLWQVIIDLVLGGTAALMPGTGFDPDVALELARRFHLDWTVVVPTMSDAMIAAADGPQHTLTTIVSASAPMFTATKQGLLELFPDARLNECYGATETGVVTNLGHADQLRKTRCVGTPILGVELAVLRDDGTPCDTGEVGEIVARSPYNLDEYFNLPDATKQAMRPGGFVGVGDLGRLDDEGHLYVVDRKNDMIISGGLNVYPAEVEEVLKQVDGVRDAVVVGLGHDHWGEAVTAAVVLDDPAVADHLEQACRAALPAYKVPKAFRVLDDLPRLVSGKNARRLVRDALAGAAHPQED